VLAPGLRIVFCGTAAGTESARRRCYYAHPQNKFWRALHEVGLTDRRLDCSEFALLPQFGVGLTDIAKTASGMDKELPVDALGRDACAEMAAKIRAFAPTILAFTSLTAGRRFLRRDAGFGDQQETIGTTRVWLLPSPSPAANWNWAANAAWWRALAAAAGARRRPDLG
jgi:TDG/mug DNA glycosylase family protein